MAAFLLLRTKANKAAKLWAFVCIAAALWGLGGFKCSLAGSKEAFVFWWRIGYIGVILSPVFFYHFVYTFLNLDKEKYHRRILFLTYILGIIFLILNLFFESVFFGAINSFKIFFNQFYWYDWVEHKSILWISFYISFFWFLLGYSFIVLVRAFKKARGVQRNQLKYFIVGSVIAWLGAEMNFISVFRINIYPYLNILIALYPPIMTYAIIKYRLMDIRVAVTRAGIFIAVYTLVLGIPFAIAFRSKAWLIDLFGPNWWMSPLGLMAVLATSGPFIYIYLERKAEDRLLKEQRRYQDTLKQASIGMTRIRSLRKLLDLITHIVTRTVRIDYVAIYLHDKQADEYVLQVMRDKGRIPIPKLPGNNHLVSWISTKREPLVYEEILRQAQDTGDSSYKLLEENMRILTASVIIPSFLEDKIMGFIVFGNKISGQIYTPDDLNVFQVLASQAALAIENAQFYEDAKEMQQQIAQAEKMATIGTMADGLSHQINNRFYALSLIAGDSIDTIKLTDTSKCTPEIKKMIEEINYALGRIQSNVVQGGEVVRGLLKYSRKGEEGLDALDLNKIIDNTLEMVQFKVKLSDIDIVRNFTDIPKIKGNMTQLEEVFFNFIDNAYDATVERKTTLQEPGYRGKITISAQAKDSKLEIIFEDNGMGIKDADNRKIFTPFFTTKTSARKGTGLGLYVINKIITDAHKGKIVFESAYKVGTRFIIELPIAQ